MGSSTKSEYGWQEEDYGTCGNQQRQHGQAQFRAGISYMSTMHGGGCVPGASTLRPATTSRKIQSFISMRRPESGGVSHAVHNMLFAFSEPYNFFHFLAIPFSFRFRVHSAFSFAPQNAGGAGAPRRMER